MFMVNGQEVQLMNPKLRIEIERETNRALSIVEIKTNVNTQDIKHRLKAHYQQRLIATVPTNTLRQQLAELNELFGELING
jgi:hypothetical protein